MSAFQSSAAPYEALALYSVITYMDTVGGVFYPAGGLRVRVAWPARDAS